MPCMKPGSLKIGVISLTDNINKIFKQNIKLLGEMDLAVLYFREQQCDKALGILAHSIHTVKSVIESIISDREYFHLVDTESLLEMLTGILNAKKNEDYILLADYLELQLISFLAGVQELIISKEEIRFDEQKYLDNVERVIERGEGFPEELKGPIPAEGLLKKGYRVEFTSCGLMTLAAEVEGEAFYFHTNSRVQAEAFLLARQWSLQDKKRYILYGFGMGYHIAELLKMNQSAEIVIYEADLNVIQLACAFTEIKDILASERVTLIYDPDFEKLPNRIATILSEETFIVHYPSYKNIRSKKGKDILKQALPWEKIIEAC